MENKLWFGDNITILRHYVPSESIDLIYLDPPFNSNASYNVLFKAPDGSHSDSQLQAFDDTWHWTHSTEAAFDEVMGSGSNAATLLRALRSSLGENDMMAYLTMMAVRLIEMRRALKDTGSLYLHCDATASHYLKLLLDVIFGARSFQNEIIWKRTTTHSDSKTWSRVADTILFYTAGKTFTWNIPREPHGDEYLASKYRHDDGDGRRYQLDNITSPNPRPNMMYEWKGFPFPQKGWRYSRETMQSLHEEGRIWYPRHPDGSLATSRRPRLKRYLDEMEGGVMGTIWTDISPLNSQARERLGYPTQKPLRLLERIIETSSKPGDVVLDPFCGCGTAIHAAEQLGRRWIGIDVTPLAIQVIRDRFKQHFPHCDYSLGGVPTSVEGARALADHNKLQFEFWVVGHIGGRPKDYAGADRGVDGRFFFKESSRSNGMGVISVKGGRSVGPSAVRELRGVIDRENADIGALVCVDEPTTAMKTEAATAGIYTADNGDKFPRLQILSLKEIFEGKALQAPPLYTTVTSRVEARRRGKAKPPTIPPQDAPRQRSFLLPIEGSGRAISPAGVPLSSTILEEQSQKTA